MEYSMLMLVIFTQLFIKNEGLCLGTICLLALYLFADFFKLAQIVAPDSYLIVGLQHVY